MDEAAARQIRPVDCSMHATHHPDPNPHTKNARETAKRNAEEKAAKQKVAARVGAKT